MRKSVMHTLITVSVILFCNSVYPLTMSYYQNDGKGAASATDCVGVDSWNAPWPPDAGGVYSGGGFGRLCYLGFFNIFGDGQYQIKEDSTVLQATLYITDSYSGGFSGNGTLYRVTTEWHESTLNWSRYLAGDGQYTTAGGIHFSYSYSAPQTVAINVTSYLQEWAAEPDSNFGWMFTTDRTTEWYTDDTYMVSYRPKLVVQYELPVEPPDLPSPVPEPATIVLAAMAFATVLRRVFKK
ncbi:MAG: DNRLRE domain-containing protein [Candidatus Auribacter fodinae]|uniref:DNRLRE domain-containing protein n=1 Tax=Candidatus Auribacter fodinae TaxID=2093366 RepID=A0A3A4R134_9BACT|nr:MAG: DNRLRE domain-containing protein [Candidatus Auribacter fodinae]